MNYKTFEKKMKLILNMLQLKKNFKKFIKKVIIN